MGNVLTKITSSVGKVGNTAILKIRKHSPEILLGCGIAGFAGTIFLSCRATLHAEEIIDRHNKRIDDANKAAEVADEDDHYDIRREKAVVYAYTVKDFVKLYAAPFATAVFSISCILISHNIMRKRYLGVVAAYSAVSSAFEAYRSRVKEELGEDMDRHFRFGTEKKEIDISKVDENGNEVVEKKEVEAVNLDGKPSIYAKYFDSSNPNWDRNITFSLFFLRAQEQIATDILRAKGHIFLNEVYDMLGFEHTQIGAVTGWVLGEGDDFVDFGLYDIESEQAREFVNGTNPVILLDFNVDGVIWDKI